MSKVAILYFGGGHIHTFSDFCWHIQPSHIDNTFIGKSSYVVVFLHGYGGMGVKWHESNTSSLRILCEKHSISHCCYYRTMFLKENKPSAVMNLIDTYNLEYEYLHMLDEIDEEFGSDKQILVCGHSDIYAYYPFRLIDLGLISSNYDKSKLKYTREKIYYNGSSIDINNIWDDIRFHYVAYDTKDDYENRFIIDYDKEDTPNQKEPKLIKIENEHWKNLYEIHHASTYSHSLHSKPEVAKIIFEKFIV